MAIGDYYSSGSIADKLYHWSAMSSTIRNSASVSSYEDFPLGMEWDGTDILLCGYTNWIYKVSGGFTTTIKTSLDCTAFETIPGSISEDQTDIVIGGDQANKHYKLSGKFSSTIKTSRVAVNQPFGISWDGTDINWASSVDDKIRWGSGTFTSTVKSSAAYGAVDTSLCEVSWDGTNTPFIGFGDDKIYLSSGRHTTTLKDSNYIGGSDGQSYGLAIEDYESRLGLGNGATISRLLRPIVTNRLRSKI